MHKSLEIAVTPWSMGTLGIASELTDQAVIAEKMGCHSFWLPESHFGDTRSIPSPLTLLAAVAACTSKIKLGSTSYLLPIRHPLQAAEEVAVLDRLSGGRVILGVGRGTQQAMFDAFDVPTKDKRSRFAANLETMTRAWRGEPIGWDNSTSAPRPITLAPLPVQSPHPPIWVAAFGPLALKQAGSLGFPYLASPIETLETLSQNYARHRQFATAAGHAPTTTVPIMRTVFMSHRVAECRQVKAAMAASSPHSMRDQTADIDDWSIIGDPSFVRDKIDEYRDRLGVTHMIVRGRVPGVTDQTWLSSLEKLVAAQ
ncbi:MAG: LLM class flavin-dependent oxidoreductase [SAR86 cluster bacterium]|uniref:LLM class flavin-dependent oxidoreductase n=1 Tax=SAR86 cluster bacterium TaxID=2030880 RepID=A0A972VXE6_9GAMM|nr:LLM class flavin-dependent oxidoreductase [SAR86 cluster bacterium]